MAYDLLDENMNEVLDDEGTPSHQRHLLSLQDMDRSAYLEELIDAGVTTFKIEGRLKDADYVTNITAYYRDLMDRYAERTKNTALIEKRHIYSRSFIPNPEKTFHRGGIDYFLHGRTAKMANWDTPKSTGEAIGKVIEMRGNSLRVRLKAGISLHNGDGLSLGAEGFSVNGIDGEWIKINKSLAASDFRLPVAVFRNLDVEFVKSLHSERKIPVDILFRETEDGFDLQIGEQEEHFV
jgi:putative protease